MNIMSHPVYAAHTTRKDQTFGLWVPAVVIAIVTYGLGRVLINIFSVQTTSITNIFVYIVGIGIFIYVLYGYAKSLLYRLNIAYSVRINCDLITIDFFYKKPLITRLDLLKNIEKIGDKDSGYANGLLSDDRDNYLLTFTNGKSVKLSGDMQYIDELATYLADHTIKQ